MIGQRHLSAVFPCESICASVVIAYRIPDVIIADGRTVVRRQSVQPSCISIAVCLRSQYRVGDKVFLDDRPDISVGIIGIRVIGILVIQDLRDQLSLIVISISCFRKFVFCYDCDVPEAVIGIPIGKRLLALPTAVSVRHTNIPADLRSCSLRLSGWR